MVIREDTLMPSGSDDALANINEVVYRYMHINVLAAFHAYCRLNCTLKRLLLPTKYYYYQ